MIPKSYDLDKWVAKYFVSKDETYRDTEKRRKDTEKCTIQYLFSMSVSFPYHFSIFSVSEFFIGLVCVEYIIIIINNFNKKQICKKYCLKLIQFIN